MSTPAAQITQYKDAIKFLKKKCSSTENQYNELKSKYDSLESTFVNFLEFITSPFNESNLQPDLTIDGLRCWWEVKKEGLFIEEGKKSALDNSTTDGKKPSALQSQVVELTTAMKKLEFAKKDLEFNLERKTNECKTITSQLQQQTEEVTSCKKDLQVKDETIKELEAQISTIRNEVTSLFISLSQYLDIHCEKEEEIKPVLYSTVQAIFPSSSSSSTQDEGKSTKDIDLVLLSTMDKVSLLKTRFHSLEEDLVTKSSLINSQTTQLNELIKLSENDKEMITQLRQTIERLKEEKSDKQDMEKESDERMKELEKSNAGLRSVIESLKDSLLQQQKQVEESESKCISIQQELVSVQQNSNDIIQQMYSANEEKMKSLQEENEKLHGIAEDANNEVSTLRLLLDQTTKEYEQELTVLREKKYAVEQQVTVSEKFLDSTNRAHREELTKLTLAEKEAQKETQILRISLVEKESELRACMENYATLREDSQKQIQELTKRIASMEYQMKEEKSQVEEERKTVQMTGEHFDMVIQERIQEVEQREREQARQKQREYEEELVRVRKQVQVLSHQLEEERKGNRKVREQINQLNDIISTQNDSIDQLRSSLVQKDSELLAGKQQINQLTTILTKKFTEPK